MDRSKIILKKNSRLRIIAFLLFITLIIIGFTLSTHKPLWNDEIFTQVGNVEGLSYGQLISGSIGEGNNCPLFYAIQKSICRLIGYSYPLKGTIQWYIVDHSSQIILRIGPNIFMALSLALIFYFFSRYYSLWSGIYSLLISLSSYMVWVHWAEARPYGLWFFLTTVQTLLFLRMITPSSANESVDTKLFGQLAALHIAMSLSTILSLLQILIVSFLLWMLKRGHWKKYAGLTIIPLCICIFYFFRAPKYPFRFFTPPWHLIQACVSIELMAIIFAYALFLLFYVKTAKIKREVLRDGKCFLGLMALLFAAAAVILIIFKIGATDIPHQGFGVTDRYFIYLTPASIIAATLFSIHFIRAFKGQRWMLINIGIILGGLLTIRFYKTFMDVNALGLYWF